MPRTDNARQSKETSPQQGKAVPVGNLKATIKTGQANEKQTRESKHEKSPTNTGSSSGAVSHFIVFHCLQLATMKFTLLSVAALLASADAFGVTVSIYPSLN